MNKELIQKFLNKACYDGQDQYELEDWLNVEKFAQLIVRECSRVAKLEVGTNRVCDAIEKHFGVEL